MLLEDAAWICLAHQQYQWISVACWDPYLWVSMIVACSLANPKNRFQADGMFIMEGDEVVAVNGTLCEGQDLEKVSKLVKESEGRSLRSEGSKSRCQVIGNVVVLCQYIYIVYLYIYVVPQC